MQTAIATQDHSKPLDSLKSERITAKVRTAVEAMVWQGLHRREAAETAGLAEHSLYQALRKPLVRRFYLAELEVLRTSERARNIHALTGVRDQTENKMATVAAVKALEQLDDSPTSTGIRSSAPGVTIVINGNAPVQAVVHDAVTIDNDAA